ncbi:MAG: helix-turn-helix transcriptional regulator [Microbacterium sp.]|nr:helix-turn-helix transcriptional regulator [Microbacterium sp.]
MLRQQVVVVLHLSQVRDHADYPVSVQHLDHADDLSRLEHLLMPAKPTATRSPLGRLTTRQREVLERAARGETNAEIAAALVVATGTVKRHLHDVYHALGVRGRSEAAYALRFLTEGGQSNHRAAYGAELFQSVPQRDVSRKRTG